MTDTIIGKLITDGKTVYRVYYCSNFTARLIVCSVDDKPMTRFELLSFNVTELRNRLQSGEFSIVEEKPSLVVDEAAFDEKSKKAYKKNKDFMADVCKTYGPEYIYLGEAVSSEAWEGLLKEHHMNRKVAWKLVRRYLQSGLCASSLVDMRKLPRPKISRVGTYKVNPGPKAKYSKVLTPEDIKNMDECIQIMMKDEVNSVVYYHSYLMNHYYLDENGNYKEFPSLDQFLYRVKTTVPAEFLAKRKLDAAEARNNYRLTLESARMEASRPGQYIEVDECELCVNIVSSADRRQIIGKPILYLAADVYSHAIVGLSVLLYNNAFGGISSVLLNMFEGSEKYFARYGVVKGAEYIPSCFCPEVIKSDQGSEYTSYNFEDLCLELGTMHNLLPVKLGSYKGTVERKFRFIQEFLSPALKDHGLITGKHDSNHKETACYTLEAITQMCMNIAVYHNTNILKKLRLPRAMSLKISKKPIELWNYGVEHFGAPIPVTDKNRNEYFYKCLIKEDALVTRSGISVKGLTYYENTPEINAAMYKASYDGKTQKILVGIDLRDAGHIYYNNNGQIIPIPLIAGQMGNDYENVTWSEYFREREIISERNKEDKRALIINRAVAYRNNDIILANQETSEFKPKKTGIKEARNAEKELTAGPERVFERMGFTVPQIEEEEEQNEKDNEIPQSVETQPVESQKAKKKKTVSAESEVKSEPVTDSTDGEENLSLAELSRNVRKDVFLKAMKDSKYIKHD